jgi:hypothetical protein
LVLKAHRDPMQRSDDLSGLYKLLIHYPSSYSSRVEHDLGQTVRVVMSLGRTGNVGLQNLGSRPSTIQYVLYNSSR